MLKSNLIREFSRLHKLPLGFEQTAHQHFYPLAEALFQQASDSPSSPIFVGIHGCQGSGKSTLTDFLLYVFEHDFNVPAVGMSIDDFYLTRAQRLELSASQHPLFKTRGVPGTHDIELLENTFKYFSESCYPVQVPVFNKAMDDRVPAANWREVVAPVSIVILEGWCVGTPPQAESELEKPVNDLEALEDPTGTWRRYVNNAIAQGYASLFGALDTLIMLKAPSFSAVYQWRLEQEVRLRDKLESEGQRTDALMSEAQINRFIQHYQRLTEHALSVLPEKADVIFSLNDQRHIVSTSSEEGV